MPRTPEGAITFSSRKDSISKRPQAPDIPMNPEYWTAKRKEFGIPDFDHKTLIDVQEYLEEIPLEKIGMIGRSTEMTIQSGGLPEKLNPYLRMLMFLAGEPIQLQFIAQKDKEHQLLELGDHKGYLDPLQEDKYKVDGAPGIINKYKTRVLFIVTDLCAAFCRHCTRGREVGTAGARSIDEIDQSIDYIKSNKEIREVIFSGGDPFTLNEKTFAHLVERIRQLQEDDRLDSVRFGSRRLIQTGSLPEHIYEGLSKLYHPNVMHHYNHPLEITKQVKEGLDMLHQAGATMYSQSVLLKGVNNDREVMKSLFTKGQKYGVIPYYVFLCDEVEWGQHFMVPFSEVRQIFHRLPEELNGLAATARVVIDGAAGAKGKIPLDSGYWQSATEFEDYQQKGFRMTEGGYVVPSSHSDSNSANQKETLLFPGN